MSSEGSEFIRQPGEHRTSFVRRYLDVLGQEGMSLFMKTKSVSIKLI